MTSAPGTAFGGATDPSVFQLADGFRVVPSITVGERYDSNVFFAPKTPGLNREDFVTTAIPQVRGLYTGDLVTVNAMANAMGEYYVKNSGLSYVGTNANAMLDVSKLASRLWQGTQVIVRGDYSYTPQPPAFLTGDLSGAGTNPYVRGFQTGRVNVQTNSFGGNLSVPISATINMTGSYLSGFQRFGASQVQQPGVLLNTSYQTYMAGLSMKASPQDVIKLDFVNSEYVYEAQGSFTTRGGIVGWSHLFTQNVSLNSAAGVQLVETKLSIGSSSTDIGPIGNVSLLWNNGTTSMLLAYNLNVTPSVQFQGQPLLTQVTTFTLTQQVAIPELLGVFSLSYGRGDEFGGSSSSTGALSYISYSGTGGLIYKFTPKTFLGLTYSYSDWDQSFGGQSFRIDRQFVQMSLSQALY